MGNLTSNELKAHDKTVRIVNRSTNGVVNVLTSGGQMTTFLPGEVKVVAEKLGRQILAEANCYKLPLGDAPLPSVPKSIKKGKKGKKGKK
jgi:hypothetical protein